MKKIGLVLSGGGVRGIAHLGILKFLEECGCVINCISGTSTGAMLGAFNAFGYSAQEILTITKNTKLFSLSDVAFSQSGIFNMKGIEESIIKHIPENTFECLRFPLHATATNILTGEAVYFSTGILSSQLMASSCVPFIFKPIEYQGCLLYTSDAADERSSVDLGGRRIIKKKKHCTSYNDGIYKKNT